MSEQYAEYIDLGEAEVRAGAEARSQRNSPRDLMAGAVWYSEFVSVVNAYAARMLAEYGVPLVLVAIDTLGRAAGFRDENDAAEGQKVMGVLAGLARATKTCVLVVDHFGKAVETGTRGTSAKET